MNTRAISVLRMLLYVGAARADGTPGQVSELRARVLPALEDGASDQEVRKLVREVMGPRWRPSGEWAAQIQALTD